MIKSLANFFRAIHLAFGMTGIPDNATAAQERKFVAMWFVILAVIAAWCVLLAHWFAS